MATILTTKELRAAQRRVKNTRRTLKHDEWVTVPVWEFEALLYEVKKQRQISDERRKRHDAHIRAAFGNPRARRGGRR